MTATLLDDKRAEYEHLHARVWPEVTDALRDHNIENFSIFVRDRSLFGYLEYVGTDFEQDMNALADTPAMRRWLARTDACQESVSDEDGVRTWQQLREIFYLD